MSTHCFFHKADLDGHCSGALVQHAIPDAILHPFNYKDEFPWGDIQGCDDVYFVDISMSTEEMIRLNDLCHSFIWIDHHQTSIEAADKSNFKPEGIRRVGEAACELTWRFLFSNYEMPEFVRMLGRYDVWDHKDDPDILALQHGLRSVETLPSKSTDIWRMLFDYPAYVYELVAKGKVIKAAVEQAWRVSAESLTHLVEFEGLRFLAANISGVPSQFFDSLIEGEKHDGLMTFAMQRGKWKVSLRSNKIDVSQIALKYGGGGHKGAAGFELPDPPLFKIIKNHVEENDGRFVTNEKTY